VGPLEELPPGSVKIVVTGSISVGVYNCGGELFAIEDRCSHDDGPLAEGDWEPDECVVICPRHGSRFDLRTGRPLSLPAFEPVDTFPVRVVDGIVRVDVI
jgi:3-phenylpropionate/trans-cinnamate dioxygenase ferredoxin component